MGLSSSQARLLTLTSRQHSIEGEAHRLQANKLRLSNDSDTAYMKYLNALDDTFLKTRQVKNDTGAASWIDASINNLMRYQTSDETTGKVFYVQDIGTGKLYIPTEIGNKFDSSTGMREFVMACDPSIEYEEHNENEQIEKKYLEMISKGYDTVLAPTIEESNRLVSEYYEARVKEAGTIGAAKSALNQYPLANSDGNYTASTENSVVGQQYRNVISNIINQPEYRTTYTAQERKLLEESLLFMNVLNQVFPDKETVRYSDYTEETVYAISEISSAKNGKKYTTSTIEYGETNTLLSMLNGGTLSWVGKKGVSKIFDDTSKPKESVQTNYNFDIDIYNYTYTVNGTSTTLNDVLQANAPECSTMGEAIYKILKRVASLRSPVSEFLSSNGITKDDIKNYQEYRQAAEVYKTYEAVMVWKANDPVKAAYYEEIYNAITAAGGWIEADEARAKNGTWVSNMVKNAQVIITDWDESKEILTNTTTALVTNLKEVTDQNYIEKVSQEYEDTLNTINAKDARFDKRLAQLESERSAIMTEVDGLKSVMKNNIEKTFKVFG